ncbi:MAG: hypothetical protein ACYCSS_07390 [Sulfuriferula sp.]
MMNYLAMLKKELAGDTEAQTTDIFQLCPVSELTKLTQGASVSSVSTLNGANENIYCVPVANHEHDFDTPLTPAEQARHDRVLKMLDDNPEIYRAITVDDLPDHSVMTVGMRGVAVVTMELLVGYDRFALLALIEQHGQATH